MVTQKMKTKYSPPDDMFADTSSTRSNLIGVAI
jgi:hypothetical protein